MTAHRSSLHRALVAAAIGLLVALPVVSTPQGALAEPSVEDKVAERDDIDQRLADLRYELDDVSTDLADTYVALAETEMLIPGAQDLLEDAQAELAAAQEEDRRVGERLRAAQAEEGRLTREVEEGQAVVDATDEELAQVAIEAYKGGGVPNPATVYVGSEDPQDSVDRMVNYRLTLASQGTLLDGLRSDQAVSENSADRLTAVREEIDALKAESEAAVARTERAETEAQAAKDELDGLYASQKTQRDELEAAKVKFEGERKQLEADRSQISADIDALVAQERAAAQTGDATTTSGEGWLKPVSSRMNSSFGWRVHPIYRTRKFHAGGDFPVGCGTPVRAMESGRVVQTGFNRSAGNKLVMSHGTHGGVVVTSSYHHLQGFAKPQGATVAKGDVIGYVGSTGGSTGCHLHFEVHENGQAVDPAGYTGY